MSGRIKTAEVARRDISPCGVGARERAFEASDAVAFVLAGGRSSRMGADKALEMLAGRPLIAWALELLREAGLSASIAGGSPQLEAFAPVVADARPGEGPLGGICAALASTSADRAVFVPVDLPLLPASLVVFLLHDALRTGAAVTLASVNGFAQSFPAVVGREALAVLRSEMEAGRRGCFSAFVAAATQLGQPLRVLPVEFLLQSGHVAHAGNPVASRWFVNVNTPAELEFAGRLLAQSESRSGLSRVK